MKRRRVIARPDRAPSLIAVRFENAFIMKHILGIFDAHHKTTGLLATASVYSPLMTPDDPDLTVRARGLTRRYNTHLAVDSLDLDLKRGEILGLLGPNGAGKTTTMQMLTGNIAPSSGEILIRGHDLLESPTRAKSCIGYLPETPPLYRELNVGEYLHFAARLHRVGKAERPGAIERTMQRCGLKTVARKLIGTLSKGYQQRVGIAQAIVHEPDVVILDEPTVGLDPNQILEIRTLIRELGREHSVILSTHIMQEVEAVCDRVQIMHHGKVVFSNTVDDLRAGHNSRAISLRLHRPPSLETLRGIDGVAAVEDRGSGSYLIRFEPGSDPTAMLVSRASSENWGLLQLVPAHSSLEEIFAQLTGSESTS